MATFATDAINADAVAARMWNLNQIVVVRKT
jgi:hypothetical protein